jgi:methionyl-tRNA formyltransferase
LQLVDGKVLAGAAVGSVELLEVQPAGKKSMKATDWFRGLRDQEVKVTND